MEEVSKKLKSAFQNGFSKIIISNKSDKSNVYNKIIITPYLRGKDTCYQLASHTSTQVFHVNFESDASAIKMILEKFSGYRQMNIFGSEDVEIKVSSKGKVFIVSKKGGTAVCAGQHNREKNYILNSEDKILPLIDLGVITEDGKIKSGQNRKFKQIERFIETIDSIIVPKSETFNVIDFGCGKSYLTFILYHYLTVIKKLNVKITGLDLKPEVVEKCNVIAEKYGYKNLFFKIGDIKDYKTEQSVDMVITLHACDTATDYALNYAMRHNAEYIFSVPCCQHELNSQINDALFAVTNYGLLKERFAAILTDGVRCEILRAMGYRVTVSEFIEEEHTPKNLLISATKTGNNKNIKLLKEIEDLCKTYGAEPTLLKLI